MKIPGNTAHKNGEAHGTVGTKTIYRWIPEELVGLSWDEADVGPRAGEAFEVTFAVVSRDAAVRCGDQLVGHVCQPAVRECITPEANFLFHGSSLELFQSLEFCWADDFRTAQVHLGVTPLDQFPGDVSLGADLGNYIALIIQFVEIEFDLGFLRQKAGENVTKAIAALSVGTDR